jgi:hypothetical protein
MDRETKKDPARKRSFNPEPDVASLLYYWGKENPSVIEARMINNALREFLRSYDRKRKVYGSKKGVAA